MPWRRDERPRAGQAVKVIAVNNDNHSDVQADAYFAMIPEWVLDSNITPSSVVVYLTLARYANRRTRVCYPSKETIAERSGLSSNTVSKSLRQLKDVGAITSKRRNRNGTPTSNVYVLHMAGPFGAASEIITDEALIPIFEPLIPIFEALIPNVGTQTRQDNQTKRTRSISPSSFDDERFNEFWDIYPRRIAKPAALKAWLKALTRTSPDEIILGAQQFAVARQGQNPKYTPHPSSWLNAERWTDELDPVFIDGSRSEISERLFQDALTKLGADIKELGA